MTDLDHKLTDDILFKMVFLRLPERLKDIIAGALDIPSKSISEFRITNPEMPPEIYGEKFCRFDVKMDVD
ncbi:MAG: Rpn family recombination-promoting nuclease/putative transposase, partial [Deltaproteobacteria bacterium]|nr:Rpn family recombination-promoting nuclease/putative transposase [Deltaproteobacteria bacterium]